MSLCVNFDYRTKDCQRALNLSESERQRVYAQIRKVFRELGFYPAEQRSEWLHDDDENAQGIISDLINGLTAVLGIKVKYFRSFKVSKVSNFADVTPYLNCEEDIECLAFELAAWDGNVQIR